MARRSSVRYWPSRHAYGCWFGGTQHILAEGPDDFPGGPTYQAALLKFGEITAMGSAPEAKDKNTVRVVCESYLRWISTRRRAGTLKIRKLAFVPFAEALGEVEVRSLTHHRVYAWLDEMREERVHPGTGLPTRWTDPSVRNACTGIQAAFNWAAKSGLITRNPLVGLEQPEARSRGREALTGKDPAERAANHLRILAAATRAFRPFVICLEATGCRPGELANAAASDFDAALGAIVYHADDNRLDSEFRHKTSGKGRGRIIMFSGESLEVVKGLAEVNVKGPLFRTGFARLKSGGPSPWTDKEVTNRFRVIREAVGIPRLTAYSYRHTFATAWLEQGKSVDILAELLGNSPAVIRKHYSHLLGDTDNLRRQLESFRAEQAAGTRTPPPSPPSGAGGAG